MTPRAIIFAWALALAFVAAPLLARLHAPIFHGAQIAVIGSSQVRYAVPVTSEGGGSLLADNRSHFRFGLDAISEVETDVLLEQAIDERADLIFVDIGPLLYDNDWGHSRGRCDQPLRQLRATMKQAQMRVTRAWAGRLGIAPNRADAGEPLNLDAKSIDLATAHSQFPLHVRGPCDWPRLAAAVAKARKAGIRIVLLHMPRSTTADRLIGQGQARTVDAMAASLAARLRLPLFAPTSPWPDELFVSVGHLSRTGRSYFIATLRGWMATQR